MKKWLNFSLTFLFVFCLVLLAIPQDVQASKADPAPVKVASGGNWTMGKEFEVDLNVMPAPRDWLELISQGVKVSTTGELCHPFRGHFYYWKADIYRLVDGEWVKLKTTYRWRTNYESDYMACVSAKAGGTYAMFGYYDGPTEY